MLSLPDQDDCKTRKDTKHCITKQGPNTESLQTILMNQQKPNHCLRKDSSLNHLCVYVGEVLKCIYWYHIFALDSVVVKIQTLFRSHGGFLVYAMYHLRDTI